MISRFVFLFLLTWVMGNTTTFAQRPTKPTDLRNYFTGNATRPVNQPVGGPGVLLMGGGSEVDAAFISYAYPIANGGDFVILRTDNSNGYQSYLYTTLTSGLPTNIKPNSVETLVVNSRTKADYAYVKWAVEGANCIFMAGGDQSDYINYWKGTALETALRAAYARGAIIGGTSAGACVMGNYIYDPDGVTGVVSDDAIANPYRSSMLFTTGFGDFPLMRQTYVEPHFVTRTRMGRSLAIMARLRQDEALENITTLAMDENSSIFINSQGVGIMQRQTSTAAAYVLSENRRRTRRIQVAAGVPVIYRNVNRTKLAPNNTYDLTTGATNGVTTNISVEGSSTPNLNPSSPY